MIGIGVHSIIYRENGMSGTHSLSQGQDHPIFIRLLNSSLSRLSEDKNSVLKEKKQKQYSNFSSFISFSVTFEISTGIHYKIFVCSISLISPDSSLLRFMFILLNFILISFLIPYRHRFKVQEDKQFKVIKIQNEKLRKHFLVGLDWVGENTEREEKGKKRLYDAM